MVATFSAALATSVKGFVNTIWQVECVNVDFDTRLSKWGYESIFFSHSTVSVLSDKYEIKFPGGNQALCVKFFPVLIC